MNKTLYKVDKKGKVRVWQVQVNDDVVKVSTGIKDMGMVHSFTICEPKNVGKKNETSANEQAIKDALSKYNKKINREGYTENLDTYDTPFSVQLCSNFFDTPQKCIKNATGKMWYQHKLDGLKGYYKDGKIYSRKDTVYGHIDEKLLEECEVICNLLKYKYDLVNPILDGELFINNTFWLEDLNSIVSGGETLSGKDKKGNVFTDIGPKDVNLHLCNVYDDTLRDVPFGEIIDLLEFIKDKKDRIKVCKSFELMSLSETFINNKLEDVINLGDEGIIIYMNVPYKKGKHDGVWKLKNMKDAEWPIVDFKETKVLTEKDGGEVKQFQHICECENGERFSVRMVGDNRSREEIGTGKFVGKLLKVQYQGLLKSGKPQFPVGLVIREDI